VTRILEGDCRLVLSTLEAGSVQCCVTSPPYWSLRDYGTATWEGGEAGCDHINPNGSKPNSALAELADKFAPRKNPRNPVDQDTPRLASYRDTCLKCGARRIDSQLGLEETPEEYIANMVAVFREVKRVLRDDGTCWINLGDSFGAGSNLSDCIAARIKGSVLCIGSACTLTITTKGKNVLRSNNGFPNGKLARFFGLKRVFFKQGNNHLRQVFNLLQPESCVVVDGSLSLLRISESDVEIALNQGDDIDVVVSQRNLNSDASLEIPVCSGATENGKTTFAVKESAEPIAECVSNGKTARNAISFDTLRKSGLQIDSVHEPISFRNAAMARSDTVSDFTVTKASGEKLTLTLMHGAIEIAFGSVGHVYFRNGFGSLISYTEIYDQAYRDMRENGAKQELGIPFRLRRALVRDGWICRSTIIWHKPNPMPESVTDRPTKSHEYIFLLTKSERYFYDAEAIREKTGSEMDWDEYAIKTAPGATWQSGGISRYAGHFKTDGGQSHPNGRNKRSVWTVATRPYVEAHFATFPEDLIKPCILAGSKPGDTVLDPFAGSGTTGKVAIELGRRALLIELNPQYVELIWHRTNVTAGMF
jgi:DNA modification methylase